MVNINYFKGYILWLKATTGLVGPLSFTIKKHCCLMVALSSNIWGYSVGSVTRTTVSRKSNSSWITGAISVFSGAPPLGPPPICPVPVLSRWPLLCRCQYICPLSSGSIEFSLFSLPVICSFHPSFPPHSPCCGAIQQESAATALSTSPSLSQRRPDLCLSRWESSVLLV